MLALKDFYNKKTAVYGLSTETEKALPELLCYFNIIGLLDGFKDSGEMFGQPIIPFNQAVAEGVELIIVIARPGSCKAIAKRIGDTCRTQGISLFDIRGKDLLQSNRIVFDFKSVQGYTYSDAVAQIESAEVVSFDLFDTLLMRTVLSSSDVHKLVCARLQEKGIEIKDFVNLRLAAEKELSRDYAPTLTEIYAKVLETSQIVSPTELAELEYEIEKTLLVPRRDTVKLFELAKELGKKVYITTDTYYIYEQIEEILHLNRISNYDSLLVSCHYRTGKTQKLFCELKKIAGTDNIVHIGDDIVADVSNAKLHGISAFWIYSGAELLDLVGGLGLEDYTEHLSDRIRVGMFVADIFNSPFQFEDEECKIKVQDAFNIGYLFCAPMINDFVSWFGKRVIDLNIPNIWFCARDGYLIQKLFEKYYPQIQTEYFMTSRTAAIRAGVENKDDVAYVDGMKFSGTAEDNLLKRFGILADDLEEAEIDLTQDGLMRYADAILRTAAVKKVNNNSYLQKLNIKEGAIAFFDFVAKGTSQMYAQKLLNNNILGLYFLQLEPEYMRDKCLDIEPFYTEEERETSAIFDNYYILETLLTSPDPSVAEFDACGEPVYSEETRTSKDIDCFMRAQQGIIEYTNRYLAICPESEQTINKGLDEVFLKLVHNVHIMDKDFLGLMVEDPFFNRMTDITDIL